MASIYTHLLTYVPFKAYSKAYQGVGEISPYQGCSPWGWTVIKSTYQIMECMTYMCVATRHNCHSKIKRRKIFPSFLHCGKVTFSVGGHQYSSLPRVPSYAALNMLQLMTESVCSWLSFARLASQIMDSEHFIVLNCCFGNLVPFHSYLSFLISIKRVKITSTAKLSHQTRLSPTEESVREFTRLCQ